VTAQEASALAEQIREAWPGLKVEVHDGGQSYYRYIISLE
jgi:dihydroxyacetone kinase-like predicted kinase